jgi:hypothetical protein
MTTPPTTTRPKLPPPPAPPVASAKSAVASGKPMKIGERVLLYGVGGMGKTTLAVSLPGNKLYVDLDMAIASLGLDVPCVYPTTWQEVRAVVQNCGLQAGDWLIFDSCTELQTMLEHHVLATYKTDKGATVKTIEGYGFGKGFRFIYDEWCLLLTDCDRLIRAGVNVCFVAHSSEYKVDNVDGDDYHRIEPKLQDAGDGGKSSIKEKMRDWSAHVLCIREDVAVTDKGKAKGSGTRSLYCAVNPYCVAKSRQRDGVTLDPIPVAVDNGAEVWAQVIR